MDTTRVAVVVEDEDDIRGLLSTILSQAGFDVFEAATGAEGYDARPFGDLTIETGIAGFDEVLAELERKVRQGSEL